MKRKSIFRYLCLAKFFYPNQVHPQDTRAVGALQVLVGYFVCQRHRELVRQHHEITQLLENDLANHVAET